MITHVVMMKMQDPDDRYECAQRLLAMDGRIPSLLSLEVLTDNLRRDGAYDVVLRSTHEDAEGLQEYVDHPVHQELLTWLRPRLESRAVVDAGD